jgi:threonine aldolase
VQVDLQAVQTNMVFVTVAPDRADALRAFLKARGMLIGGGSTIRLVTHLDVDAAGIRSLVDAVREFFATEPVDRPAAVH